MRMHRLGLAMHQQRCVGDFYRRFEPGYPANGPQTGMYQVGMPLAHHDLS